MTSNQTKSPLGWSSMMRRSATITIAAGIFLGLGTIPATAQNWALAPL